MRTPIEPDCYYLIPAHTPYRARAERPHRHLYVHFYLEWSFPDQQPLTFPMDPAMRDYILRLTKLCEVGQSMRRSNTKRRSS